MESQDIIPDGIKAFNELKAEIKRTSLTGFSKYTYRRWILERIDRCSASITNAITTKQVLDVLEQDDFLVQFFKKKMIRKGDEHEIRHLLREARTELQKRG